ncbi:hypothetical protein ABBQ38_002070 [Trebouxia sp. C0009 RCD-2024]
MRAVTIRSQAKLTTIPQPSRLQLLQGSCKSTLWHAKSQRLAADVRKGTKDADYKPLAVEIREPRTDHELQAVGWLRARSFYAYPPERAFAGQIHQTMIADEEYKALKAESTKRASMTAEQSTTNRSVCLVALALPHQEVSQPEGVLGTLDLYAVRALDGEVLIGNSDNAAYLANVCVAQSARRRGVGGMLIEAARQQARAWGVAALYVHIMAVNEGAKLFYELHGFTTEQEESSNQAHYRGHCLDGIEGRGRTVLLQDTLL